MKFSRNRRKNPRQSRGKAAKNIFVQLFLSPFFYWAPPVHERLAGKTSRLDVEYFWTPQRFIQTSKLLLKRITWVKKSLKNIARLREKKLLQYFQVHRGNITRKLLIKSVLCPRTVWHTFFLNCSFYFSIKTFCINGNTREETNALECSFFEFFNIPFAGTFFWHISKDSEDH